MFLQKKFLIMSIVAVTVGAFTVGSRTGGGDMPADRKNTVSYVAGSFGNERTGDDRILSTPVPVKNYNSSKPAEVPKNPAGAGKPKENKGNTPAPVITPVPMKTQKAAAEQVKTSSPQEKDIIASLPIPANVVQEKAEVITGKKVVVEDYLKAGSIILRKLDSTEIKYLFGVAKEDLFTHTSIEELNKIRSIAFSKLSTQEIEALRAIGQKYGKEMKIFELGLNVEAEKEKRMKTLNK